MKKWMKINMLLLCLILVIISSPARATITTIADTYWGANPTQGWSGDLVGDESLFGISEMAITHDAGNLQYIDIHSRYLDNVGQYFTGLGDLFLSTDGWNPNGSAPYENDNFYNSGEVWEYALSLDSHFNNQGGTFNLHQITNNDINLSTNWPLGGAYRSGQETTVKWWQCSTLATGTWSVHNLGGVDTDDYLRFDLSNLAYDFGTTDFGIHWTMTCGNDVIEGGVSTATATTPEPGSLLLLGSGLISFGIAKRLRRKKKTLKE